MQDRELDFYEWRDWCANDASGDEREELPEIDIAPNVGFPDLEAESDSRLQQAIASAFSAYVQRTIVTK